MRSRKKDERYEKACAVNSSVVQIHGLCIIEIPLLIIRLCVIEFLHSEFIYGT